MSRTHLRSHHKPQTAPVKHRGARPHHATSKSSGSTSVHHHRSTGSHKTSHRGGSAAGGHRHSGKHHSGGRKGSSHGSSGQPKSLADSVKKAETTLANWLADRLAQAWDQHNTGGDHAPPLTGRVDFHQGYGIYTDKGWVKGHVSTPHWHNHESAAEQGKATKIPKPHRTGGSHRSRSTGSPGGRHSAIAERDSHNFRPHPPSFSPSTPLAVSRRNLQVHQPSAGHNPHHNPSAHTHWPTNHPRSH